LKVLEQAIQNEYNMFS